MSGKTRISASERTGMKPGFLAGVGGRGILSMRRLEAETRNQLTSSK
jgi:hypothetical protein